MFLSLFLPLSKSNDKMSSGEDKNWCLALFNPAVASQPADYLADLWSSPPRSDVPPPVCASRSASTQPLWWHFFVFLSLLLRPCAPGLVSLQPPSRQSADWARARGNSRENRRPWFTHSWGPMKDNLICSRSQATSARICSRLPIV